MKKIFTLLLSGALFAANAQTPGYTSTSLYDDFAKAGPYADPNPIDPNFPDGIYWWGKEALGNSSAPNNSDPCFASNKYALTRTGNGKLGVTISQASNCWQPMGISTKVNLANNATFEISVTNTSNFALYFDVAIVDADKNFINCDADGNNFRALSIAAQETKILSGNFTGGQHKTWVNNSPVFTSGFDLSKVIEIDFTIVNADQPENNSWGPLAITDATLAFNYIKLGAVGGLGTNELQNTKLVSVFPNPANNGIVNFTQALSNIKLYNNMGQLLLTGNNAIQLNISTLSAGIYVLTADQGVSKVIID